jgi:hypothetical protein
MDVYEAVKRARRNGSSNSLTPISLAQVASGGADRSQIYRWLTHNLSEETNESEIRRGRPPRLLSDDQEALVVGMAVSKQSVFETVSLDILQQFCNNYLMLKPSLSTLSNLMHRHGFSSQKVMQRNSKMTCPAVVGDAIDILEQIRSFNFPPYRILSMDGTGLWSNVSALKSYHFYNWSVMSFFSKGSTFGRNSQRDHYEVTFFSHSTHLVVLSII